MLFVLTESCAAHWILCRRHSLCSTNVDYR